MYEGQGWNPYALVAEGKEAFKARVLEEGHYQRGEEGISYTDEERAQIADKAFEKAQAYVDKHNPKPEPATPTNDGNKAGKKEGKQGENKEEVK